MAFNAGGTNVSGVLAVEAGNLKVTAAPTTFSNAGGETINVDLTVPVNKKWIIKNVSLGTSTFVGTHTATNIVAKPTVGTDSFLYLKTGSSLSENLSNNIVLSAGMVLRFQMTTTAWTSGQKECKVLHQDIDV